MKFGLARLGLGLDFWSGWDLVRGMSVKYAVDTICSQKFAPVFYYYYSISSSSVDVCYYCYCCRSSKYFRGAYIFFNTNRLPLQLPLY